MGDTGDWRLNSQAATATSAVRPIAAMLKTVVTAVLIREDNMGRLLRNIVMHFWAMVTNRIFYLLCQFVFYFLGQYRTDRNKTSVRAD